MLEFAAIVVGFSFLKPPIINIIKKLWIDKLYDKEVQKSAILLVTFAIGVLFAFTVNFMGHFSIPTMEIILIGGGISVGGSQFSHRVVKFVKNGNK